MKHILFVMLVLGCSQVAWSAALNIDGSRVALADGLSVMVSDGVLRIAIQDIPVLDCADPAAPPFINLDPSSTNINTGDTLFMFASTSNTVACRPVGGGKTNWANSLIIPGDPAAISVNIPNNSASQINFSAQCVNQIGLQDGCLSPNRRVETFQGKVVADSTAVPCGLNTMVSDSSHD